MTKVFGVFFDSDYCVQLGRLFHKREDAEKCMENALRVRHEYKFFEDKEDYEYCNEYYNKLNLLERMVIGADKVFIEEVEVE